MGCTRGRVHFQWPAWFNFNITLRSRCVFPVHGLYMLGPSHPRQGVGHEGVTHGPLMIGRPSFHGFLTSSHGPIRPVTRVRVAT